MSGHVFCKLIAEISLHSKLFSGLSIIWLQLTTCYRLVRYDWGNFTTIFIKRASFIDLRFRIRRELGGHPSRETAKTLDMKSRNASFLGLWGCSLYKPVFLSGSVFIHLWNERVVLDQYFSKCSPRTDSITPTWELVWNANSQASSRTYSIRTSGAGHQQLVF